MEPAGENNKPRPVKKPIGELKRILATEYAPKNRFTPKPTPPPSKPKGNSGK